MLALVNYIHPRVYTLEVTLPTHTHTPTHTHSHTHTHTQLVHSIANLPPPLTHLHPHRDNMCEEERVSFWKDIQSIVENDVIRTDRSHPYFKGDHNPNVQVSQVPSCIVNH